MKIGDLVRVKNDHWANTGEIGIIIADLFYESKTNRKKAFRILFPNGSVRPKLSKQLELLNERR